MSHKEGRKSKDHVITFTNLAGKRITSTPITEAEAERRLRSTAWTAGAKPAIEKVKK